MLKLILGRAGFGKTYEMNSIITELAEAGRKDIIILVPEQHSATVERNIIRSFGFAAAESIEVTSFTRLGDRVYKEHGGIAAGRLDQCGRYLMLRRALAACRQDLKRYNKSADNTGFAGDILQLITELKQNLTLPADLSSAADRLPAGVLQLKIKDLCLIYSAYDGLLQSAGIGSDPTDDNALLANKLGECHFFEGKTVFVDSFKGFTAGQIKILEHVIADSLECTFAFTTDGERELFANVRKTVNSVKRIAERHGIETEEIWANEQNRRAGSEMLRALEQGFGNTAEPCSQSDDGVNLICAADPAEEADVIASNIRRLVIDGQCRYRDIAIIARTSDYFSEGLIGALKKYDIPFHLDNRKSADGRPLIRLCRTLCEAAASGSADNMLALIKSGLLPYPEQDLAALEMYCYVWRVRSEDWLKDFDKNPAGFAETEDPAVPEQLERINAVRRGLVAALNKLKRAEQTGRGLAEGLFGAIQSLSGGKSLERLCTELTAMERFEEAQIESESYGLMLSILDRFASLCGDMAMTLREFSELFAGVCGLCDLGSVPGRLDEISLGSADHIRVSAPKVAFLAGANDGIFPAIPASGGLLNFFDRDRLKETGLDLKNDIFEDTCEEDFLCYISLCAPMERLYVSYARQSTNHDELFPSSMALSIMSLFPALENKPFTSDFAGDELPLITGLYPAAELYMRQCRDGSPLRGTLKALLMETEIGRNIVAQQQATADIRENLSADMASRLSHKTLHTSASRLESYAGCAYKYFCNYMIGLHKKKPARIDSLQQGLMVHYCLERFLREYGVVPRPSSELHNIVRSLINDYTAEFLGGMADKSMRFMAELDRIGKMVFYDISCLLCEFENSDFRPSDVELSVGGEQADIPAEVIEDGHVRVEITGKVDRLDTFRNDDGTFFRVVDYKTGAKSFTLADILYSLNMQMLVYLFAVKNGGNERYGAPLQPAGILYKPSKREIASYSTDTNTDDATLKSLRPNGLLLDDPNVLEAMEHGLFGRFIPMGGGTRNSSAVPAEAFERIERILRRNILQIARDIQGGRVNPDPLDCSTPACKYCDYFDICRHGDEPRSIPALSREQTLAATGEEVKNA